ncbi:MAG: transcription-repair coupling factor [Erysipelotrichaceae bacterium]|nr:transcription-repair coupling factor [Erysipelotrichaceae bacterium]
MVNKILELLKDNPAVKSLNNEDGFSSFSLIEEALIIASSYKVNKRPILIVKNNLYNAQRLFERINSLLPEDSLLFNVEESLRVEAIASSPENTASKIETLYKLTQDDNKIIVTHVAALIRQLPRIELFKEKCIKLSTNQEISISDLKHLLLSSGYSQVSHIDQPLYFASRGGIVDFYSMNYEYPIRIEFFDTVIDSIRFFDINTQKTINQIDEVLCIPASDILFSEKDIEEIVKRSEELLKNNNNISLVSRIDQDLDYIKNHIKENRLYMYYSLLEKTGSLFDYINDPLIIMESDEQVSSTLHRLLEETTIYVQELVQENKWLPRYSLMHDYYRIIPKKHIVINDSFGKNISNIEEIDLPKDNLDSLIKILLKDEKKIIMFLNDKEIKKVIDVCIELDKPYNLILNDEAIIDGINIYFGSIFQGFRANIEGFSVVTSTELFEVKATISKYSNKFKNAEIINKYQDLNPGDYIVHNTHGVGQYIGIETRQVQGLHRDFLKVVYRGNTELLVPLEQFRLIRKFVSREGIVPKLNKLGSNEWANTKKTIKENVTQIAERLVNLYSQRENLIGYKYKEDSAYQEDFEKDFEYELTPDQKQAVIDVKNDMQSSKPMDRLLCGDVGFGKTEVAIRAAFKAVGENKQVAFLCPTTILSQQHYKTFEKRFKNYPVNIRVLNRFVLVSEQKKIIKELKEGKVDILIGTHRILSKDIKFFDLGLLIIDEEQRFGVEHKEKIKELKVSVDVLSLSATPIPRTLQMSLIGIRQLSQLETPPDNRYPVQTYVVEKNQSLIKEVIERELARDGQVFYLLNNVEEIYNTARKIQNLVKTAKVQVAHGQMNRDDIEDVMIKYTANEINVLVCTTIIETGIDIPNANTIIIENADRFGLSQLYQIKGRVGRSDRVAYAYLMIPARKELSEIASKRLKAIKEFAQLGSGYKIAMRDLTIRGAGDMLGPEQSGFIDTVGIDMYIEMLEEAIREQKGEVIEVKEEREVLNVAVEGYLPEDFTSDDYDKINMYQDIDKLDNIKDLENYKNKIIDEYGKLPKVVSSLFDKKKLDILIQDDDIEKYREIKNISEIVFSKEFSSKVNGVKLFELFTHISKDITLKYTDNKIIVRIPKNNDTLKTVFEVIEKRGEALNEN